MATASLGTMFSKKAKGKLKQKEKLAECDGLTEETAACDLNAADAPPSGAAAGDDGGAGDGSSEADVLVRFAVALAASGAHARLLSSCASFAPACKALGADGADCVLSVAAELRALLDRSTETLSDTTLSLQVSGDGSEGDALSLGAAEQRFRSALAKGARGIVGDRAWKPLLALAREYLALEIPKGDRLANGAAKLNGSEDVAANGEISVFLEFLVGPCGIRAADARRYAAALHAAAAAALRAPPEASESAELPLLRPAHLLELRDDQWPDCISKFDRQIVLRELAHK
eukprot:TRINITY_DN21285_c0_g1_i1.p2 TRINITY_DN21285_c0_g1~~TRINITY_DN21285_c0_g1_i1.p2  ORF type:complete len:289 (-),score=101.49 TRINITY_DN21285_c0_g1_i1:152-1018(-)